MKGETLDEAQEKTPAKQSSPTVEPDDFNHFGLCVAARSAGYLRFKSLCSGRAGDQSSKNPDGHGSMITLDLPRIVRPGGLNGRPPLRPPVIYPIAAAAGTILRALAFAAFVHVSRPTLAPLGTIDAELAPEGDFFEADAVRETDIAADDPAPEETTPEDTQLSAPSVAVPVRDAARLPVKRDIKKAVDRLSAKIEKRQSERREVERGPQRREAQAARRYGAPGGRGGPRSGASQATCLAHVAAALRSHTPGSTSLGPGTAFVTFHVNAGGGVSVVSASGTTPAHAALGRRIVSASRGPSTCGAAFVSQSIYFD